MTGVRELLRQRGSGRVWLQFGVHGVSEFREEGMLKLRMPARANEGILINTGGGLAGGDEAHVTIEAGPGAQLVISTQAAERVYRSLGPAAHVHNQLSVADGACLVWAPHETILFEGARLHRELDVELSSGASFIASEICVFGRVAMGEDLKAMALRDRWNIRQAGKLIHAERLSLGPQLATSSAALARYRAAGTLFAIVPGIERAAEKLRGALPASGAVSCWNGKLIARILAVDGYQVKKAMAVALSAVLAGKPLPKAWAL